MGVVELLLLSSNPYSRFSVAEDSPLEIVRAIMEILVYAQVS
jgi:hypothetical protein